MRTRHSIKRPLEENASAEIVPAAKKGKTSKTKSVDTQKTSLYFNSKGDDKIESKKSDKNSASTNLRKKRDKAKVDVERLSGSEDEQHFIAPKMNANRKGKSASESRKRSETVNIPKEKKLLKEQSKKSCEISKEIMKAQSSNFNSSDHKNKKSNDSGDAERLSDSDENDSGFANERKGRSEDEELETNMISMKSNSTNEKSRKSSRNVTKRVSYREIDEENEVDKKLVKKKQSATINTTNRKRNKESSKSQSTSPYFEAAKSLDHKAIPTNKSLPSKTEDEKKLTKSRDDVDEISNSESEEEDWVEIPGGSASPVKASKESELLFMTESFDKNVPVPSTSSKQPSSVEITFLDPEMAQKCKTKSLDEVVKQKIRKTQRDTQEYLHKSHLLSLIAHGIYLNKICSSPLLKSLALSSMTSDFIARIRPVTLEKVKLLLTWFKSQYTASDVTTSGTISNLLQEAFSTKRGSPTIITLLLVIFMRTLSIESRIILALNPLPLKLNQLVVSNKPTTSKKATKKSLGTESDEEFDIVDDKTNNNEITKHVLKKNFKMLSDNEDTIDPKYQSLAYWIEFYLPKEKRWVSLDYFSSILDDYQKVSDKLTSSPLQRLTYVLAFNQNLSVKDISAKYDSGRYTTSRKYRASSDWLDKVLQPYGVKNDIVNRLEEEEIRRILMALPFPDKIDDFNNHPLYALTRHMKKYEVMYPANPDSVGFIKEEAIYLRDNVHLCHTRETWLKSARVIRKGEQPVKKVRAQMSMKRKLLGEKDPVVELFGYWQTEPYPPPVAKGGIVPKNEHGNVDLYQECMLPIGCVYLQLPGLLRVAKKLNIDVAPAMIGWKFHARFARPILEGWVVCKEFAQKLQDAWASEEDAKDKKRDEDRTNRALKNWRRLTRFLMIRDRIRGSYDMKSSVKGSSISSVALAMAQQLAGSSRSSILPSQEK